MEQSTPPVTPNVVKTLPLKRSKSNFEQQLDSLKEDLSVLQAQLDSFKKGLSSCQQQTKEDHKEVKKLRLEIKSFGGFIEDQGKANREIRTNMAALDTEQLNNNESIKVLAESVTHLEDRIKKIELPKIVITPPTNTQEAINQNSNFKKIETYITDLTEFANEQEKAISNLDTEQIKLNELLTMLAENGTNVQDRNEKEISLLQRELIVQGALHDMELQELKTTIKKQDKSMLNLTALVLLWYYSNK